MPLLFPLSKDMAIGSTTMRRIDKPHVHVCGACGTLLGPVFDAGDFVFGRQAGRCDCSWTCCSVAAEPLHELHIEARAATEEELRTHPCSWEDFNVLRRRTT